MKKFYSREKQLEALENIEDLSLNAAKFTIITGRRRIGKTALVQEFIKDKKSCYLFAYRTSEVLLCEEWTKDVEKQLGLKIFGTITRLSELIEQILEFSTREHFILIIDEFQEIQYINPSFFSYMQNYWDKYESTSLINLIVMGSVYSMMTKIFLDSKEPLFGRATNHIKLKPFTPSVCKEILNDYNPSYTKEDLLCLYMISGGVAKYIFNLLDNNACTKEKMIDCICQDSSNFIVDAKDSLISQIGKDYAIYFSILELISKGYSSQSQIDSIINKNTGAYLANLNNIFDVIKPIKPILSKETTRNIHYKITDCYYRFYFRFIYTNTFAVENNQLDSIKKEINKYYEPFSGIALEQYFREKINEEQSLTNLGSWWDNKGENEIDIIALNDLEKTCNIYEVKRKAKKYNPSELERKVEVFKGNVKGYKISISGLSMDDM